MLMLAPSLLNESFFSRYEVIQADDTVYSIDDYHFCFAKDHYGERHLFHFETGYIVIRNLTQCNRDGLFSMLRLLLSLTRLTTHIAAKKKLNAFDKRFAKKVAACNTVSGCWVYRF